MAGSGSENRQCQRKIGVRLTDEQYAIVKEQAERAGVSMADVFRYAVFDMTPLRASRNPSVERTDLCQNTAALGHLAQAVRELAISGASALEIEAMQRDIADACRKNMKALGRRS